MCKRNWFDDKGAPGYTYEVKLKIISHKKLVKRQKFALAGMLIATVLGTVCLFFINSITRADVAPDTRFTKIMPDPDTATQQRDAHLEIAQVGDGNTLEAGSTWGKYYFDPSKVSDATIGISKGGYGGEVDTLGTSKGSGGQKFADLNAVKYEFFLAIDQQDQDKKYQDEVPCRAPGEKDPTPSLTEYSGKMSVTGWYKIEASRFVINARCNGKPWRATAKSGKYVLFVKASWNTSAPVVNNVRQGRVNAFKLGAAYNLKTGDPLTGYWSDTTWSTTDERPTNAAYAVQDRKSPEGTNGDYTFTFAPDCRLAPGEIEGRYLHWSDVDYPDYYVGLPAPSFDLIEIPPSGGSGRSVLSVGPEKNLFNGTKKQNVHHAIKYDSFKGGYTYKWVWKNITRIDGINFWIPFDDFPALRGGCGEYNYNLGLKAGTTTTPAISDATEFRAGGGQTIAANLTQIWGGKDAGSDTTTDLYLSEAGNNKVEDAFTALTPTVGGSTVLEGPSKTNPSSGKRYHSTWKLPRLGPKPTYNDSRSDIYANFKIKNDAPDGSRYCFTASITPTSNSDAAPNSSKPNSICVTIDNSLKPFLTTTGGDVHAGNDCIVSATNPRTPQMITGQVSPDGKLGSSGSYVVSAGDRITQFGSGGSPGGSNISLGNNGYYGSICRPPLATLQAELAKGGFEAVPGDTAVPFDLSSLAPGKRYLVYFTGPGTVKGKANAPVTVYSTETLTIEGKEFGSGVPAGGATRENLPTVGVIAKNIKIKQVVAGITAQLYATGNIDTCSDSTTAACRSVLLLRGFAMAHDFSFKRSGTGSNGLQLAELFGYNAAFYLNPPPGFGTASGVAKYLGERAPLY